MKRNINHETIYRFWKKHKLTKKQGKLIMEAFRRIEFLMSREKRETSYNMAGLGTPSEYKSPYFTASFGETKRVLNWYRLTADGQMIVAEIYNSFLIPKKPDQRQKVNELLFNL